MKNAHPPSSNRWPARFSLLLLVGSSALLPRTSVAAGEWYLPAPRTTFHIQLQGTVNTSYDVDAYDIDLFDSAPELIEALHHAGRHVICYFSAGSYESWRPDASTFQPADKGRKLSGWNERWLDIRSANVRAIMRGRLDLAAQKGCDAVDPDNVDGYTNRTGFPLTAADQLAYNIFLATEAHSRSLGVGLKNDLDQIPELVSYFEFAVSEQCDQYHECEALSPFITSGKPVLNIEYKKRYLRSAHARARLCAKSASLGLYTLILPRDLNDKFRIACAP